MTLIIMAAGMGNRYGGLKQIDPVGTSGEFILDYSLYDAIQAGFDRAIFIIKEENLQLFKETVGNRIADKIPVEYAFQRLTDVPEGVLVPSERTKPWGTSQAVLCCKELIAKDENFAVINADDFYGRETFIKLGEFLKQKQSGDMPHFCMAGYFLKNTITENGHVARGVCCVENGYLTDVTERTRIERHDGAICYYEEGEGYTPIDENSRVSMNCWGFTSKIFDAIEKGFLPFFEANKDNILKAEYFLPFTVNDMLKSKECDVRVLDTGAKWYGVTYHEDKAEIVAAISKLVENGEYPPSLWK